MAYPDIKIMKNNPELSMLAYLVPDVVYSYALPEGLKMDLILPWHEKGATVLAKRPLIVFVQGSGWTFPDINKQIPQLSQYARAGFAVATVTHRNAAEGHPFPAYLQDVKTAIRFLRAHADQYGIDSEHVCIFGTSSGGNTALLVGLTGDDPRFKTDEYREYSDKVHCVVECYGPANLLTMLSDQYIDNMHHSSLDNAPFIAPFRGLVGDRNVRQVLYDMSPVNYIDSCEKILPTLILHGDADEIVPYDQSTMLYEKLHAAGGYAEMIRVTDAPHSGNFWSDELFAEVQRFISEHI